MGTIDVTELLADPDFVSPVTLIHRRPTINNYGENTLVEQSVCTIGSVQPASGKTLNRLPEALRLIDVSSFWVKGEIVADGKSAYPDIICFNGQQYAVQTVQDWMNWGAGWSEGTCVRMRPSSGQQ